jgi:hypothetical protein
MNQVTIITCAADHIIVTWLFREMRRHRLPAAYALIWADSRVNPDELRAIGTEVEASLRIRSTPRAKGRRLGRTGVRVARRFNVGWPDARHPQRDFVDSIFDLGDRERARAASDAIQAGTALPGIIVGAIELALASELATIDELMANPEGLAEVVVLAAKDHGISVSHTDVLDTLRYGMTCFGPITDWILPDKVERLRTVAHAGLIELLRPRCALQWLRELLGRLGAADWLLKQMRTPEERELLRSRIAELRHKRATNRPEP